MPLAFRRVMLLPAYTAPGLEISLNRRRKTEEIDERGALSMTRRYSPKRISTSQLAAWAAAGRRLIIPTWRPTASPRRLAILHGRRLQ